MLMKVNSSLWHSYCSYLKCGFEEEEGWHFIIRIVEERSTVHLISSFHFQWRITGEIFLWNSRPGLILNTDKLKFVVHSKCPLTELDFYIEKSLCHKFVSLQCIKLSLKQVASWDYCMKDGKQFQNKFYWKREHLAYLFKYFFRQPSWNPPPKKNRMKGSVVNYIKTGHVTRPTGLKICLSFRVNGHLPTLDDITCRWRTSRSLYMSENEKLTLLRSFKWFIFVH